MKSRDEVAALFRAKYAHLKTVYPQVGLFDESKIYQNPDGGWQLNLENCAAITLRPDDDEPHETHGAICARWYQEGGAFDKGIRGRLGYPVADGKKGEDVCLALPCPVFWRVPVWNPSPVAVSSECAEFEFATIKWHEGLSWEKAKETHAYDGIPEELLSKFLQSGYVHGPSTWITENEAGQHPIT